MSQQSVIVVKTSAREWANKAVGPSVQGGAPEWRGGCARKKARSEVAYEDLLAPQWTTPGPWNFSSQLDLFLFK